MKVIRIPLKSLHNEEWFELQITFEGKVIYYGPAVLGLQKLWVRYAELYETADKLLQVIRESALTKDVEKADKKRSKVFRGFYGLVKSSLQQPNADKLKAAERLFIVLKEYRKAILKSTYNEESGALHNLLQDLTGAYSADVALLGFTEWTTALEQAEREFLALYNERQAESVAKPQEELALVRAEMDALYNAMINILDAVLMGDGLGGDTVVDPESLKDGVYESDTPSHLRGNVTYNFVQEWNETLKKYRNALQQRAGRRAKNKNEDENPEATED
jgi:hypothetical protein